MKIHSIKALEILDSRGKPTVRTFIKLDDGSTHQASVPSGASTGKHEALELRDGDKSRHHGQGVLKAVENVEKLIGPKLIGMEVGNIKKIDETILTLDGTKNKEKLGANAILSVSMAATRAAAHEAGKPLWEFIGDYFFRQQATDNRPPSFPRLMVNIVNGGKHAGWNFDIQEFMIMPKTNTPTQAVQIAAEIFQQLGSDLKSMGLSTLVGDEGGYSPKLTSNEAVFETIEAAAKKCGYIRNQDFEFAVDCAASEFFSNGKYTFSKPPHVILNSLASLELRRSGFQDLSDDNKMLKPSQTRLKQVQHDTKKYELTSAQLIEYYSQLGQKFNIQSFEDPFAEDEWDSFAKFNKTLRATRNTMHALVVGDDLFVTNPERIKKGIDEKSATAVLIKLNQIGSVSETISAIQMTQKAGWKVAVSHRSGETEDPFIADLAYGAGSDFIKTGSMSRSERLAKYNRLIEIENGI